MPSIIKPDYFRHNTLAVARNLLGKYLARELSSGKRLVGRITETEAYRGEDDPACHAAVGRTPRTEVMYGPAGRLYIYLNYGMYYMLNITTEAKGYPAAVLIRAVEPVEGLSSMRRRRRQYRPRKNKISDAELCNGPGKLCVAFGIDKAMHARPLNRATVYIEERGDQIKPCQIMTASRIGIQKGRDKLWRFTIKSAI